MTNLENNNNLIFKTKEEYEKWIYSQDWYQTIILSEDLITPGKQPTDKRLKNFNKIDFTGKSVLDVGCNSGQYCLYAKENGASLVVGIDPDPKRISQAQILAANQGLQIDFNISDINVIKEYGKFDIVLCIAVLTEIKDIINSLSLLRDVTEETAIIEMGLAKPLIYLSKNRRWFRRDKSVTRIGRVGEFHRHKHTGWVFYPTLEIVQDIFGSDFYVQYKGRGVRYDIIYASRK